MKSKKNKEESLKPKKKNKEESLKPKKENKEEQKVKKTKLFVLKISKIQLIHLYMEVLNSMLKEVLDNGINMILKHKIYIISMELEDNLF